MYCVAKASLTTDIELAQTAYTEALARYRSGCESAAFEDFRALQVGISDARLDLDIAVGLLDRHTKAHGCQKLTITPIRSTVVNFACFNCGFPFRRTREWLSITRSTECPYCAGAISFHF